jgi:hypothetical protein
MIYKKEKSINDTHEYYVQQYKVMTAAKTRQEISRPEVKTKD